MSRRSKSTTKTLLPKFPVVELWIVNASPLIALERIGCVHVLAALAVDVIIPGAVLVEVSAGSRALSIERLGKHRVVTGIAIHPIVAAWDLGSGESEVLSCAAAIPGGIAILDDQAARRCASTLGIETRGTLRVLIAAKNAGLVPAIEPLIESLRASGIFLSATVVANALKIAGETD